MRIFPKRGPKTLDVGLENFLSKRIGILALERDLEKGILESKLSYATFLFSAIALISQIAIVLFSIGRLPPKIPIFYSMPWGEAILAAKWAIWIIPGLNLVFGTLDFLLISRVKSDVFLPKVLSCILILVDFVCFWGTLKLIRLLI